MYVALVVAAGRFRHRLPPGRSNAGPLRVVAHRGASDVAPENTLAAVDLAWRLGADAVEVDVRLTADRRVVVIHDPTTDRTAGVHLEVAATDSRHLRELDVGRHRHPCFAGERIPYLEEVLETIPTGRQLFIDIKCGPEILVPLGEAVTASGKRAQVAVLGFDLDTLRTVKRMGPNVPAYWLRAKRRFASYAGSLARQARAASMDGLDVHWSGVTRHFIQAVRTAGLQLQVWTVDDPAHALRLQAQGVDGITTNCPGRVKSLLTA